MSAISTSVTSLEVPFPRTTGKLIKELIQDLFLQHREPACFFRSVRVYAKLTVVTDWPATTDKGWPLNNRGTNLTSNLPVLCSWRNLVTPNCCSPETGIATSFFVSSFSYSPWNSCSTSMSSQLCPQNPVLVHPVSFPKLESPVFLPIYSYNDGQYCNSPNFNLCVFG